jgi:hypothetical protein
VVERETESRHAKGTRDATNHSGRNSQRGLE